MIHSIKISSLYDPIRLFLLYLRFYFIVNNKYYKIFINSFLIVQFVVREALLVCSLLGGRSPTEPASPPELGRCGSWARARRTNRTANHTTEQTMNRDTRNDRYRESAIAQKQVKFEQSKKVLK